MERKVIDSDVYIKNWVRSPNSVFAGVCKGLAYKFGVEVWIIRVIWLASVLFIGIGLLLYVTALFTLPRADCIHLAYKPKFLGVCLRLSQKWQWDVGLLRLTTAFLAIASFGYTLIIYIALYFILGSKNDDNIINL